MPTYEYACLSCGTHVEVYQRITEEPLRECGVCGGSLRKVFHPAGILFRGSGFYATDSRSARKKGTERGEQADSAKAAESARAGPEGEGRSESKSPSSPPSRDSSTADSSTADSSTAGSSSRDSSTGGGTREKSA